MFIPLVDAIDISGKTITAVESILRKMPITVDNPEKKITLLTLEPSRYFVAQSGLVGASAELAPKHDEAIYQFEKRDYQLQEGEDELTVTLKWSSNTGIEVSKNYHFKRGSYVVSVEHDVANSSNDIRAGRNHAYPVSTGSFFSGQLYRSVRCKNT